jgi:PAS domain-containing protein
MHALPADSAGPLADPRDTAPRRRHFLDGGGEMGERMRALDWNATPLGPPDGWPGALKTVVRMMLDSRYAMWMAWGSDMTFFCNDAYLPTLGLKREWALGARSQRVWAEVWDAAYSRIRHVQTTGEATWDEGLLLFLERSGFAEETYHTFSYSPVYDDELRVDGMLCVVTEITDRVIGERRLRVLRDLAARTVGADETGECARRVCGVVSDYPLDLPFAALYLNEPGGQAARRICFSLPGNAGTDDPRALP